MLVLSFFGRFAGVGSSLMLYVSRFAKSLKISFACGYAVPNVANLIDKLLVLVVFAQTTNYRKQIPYATCLGERKIP